MNSPSKNASHLPPTSNGTQQLSSPRSAGRLRKLQSAHQLSANYAALNGPSLISQQRQQQQRNTGTSHNSSIPPVPALPSPQKHSRARSNSDIPSPATAGPSLRRLNVAPKKPIDPRDELKTLIRHGPRGNVPDALQSLRHWILIDGLEADTDGMVMLYNLFTKIPAY